MAHSSQASGDKVGTTDSGQAPLRLGTIRGRSKEEIAAVVQPLLDAGEACDASNPKYVEAVRQMAWVELTEFGKAVDDDLRHFSDKHPGVMICARQIMDSHIHIVVWVKQNIKQSIKQIAHGFRIGVTHIAKNMKVWPVAQACNTNEQMGGQEVVNMNGESCHDLKSSGLVLEQAFIRTLARSGQLRTMIDYVKLNPYRRWIMVLHPELFRLHRCTRIAGLRFRSLGNHWLLDWPMRQMVECRRNATQADWDELLKGVMEHAEAGAVTYTAAMNDGERYIYERLVDACLPVVKLMKDGFPPAGSVEEAEYKPGG